MSGLRKRTGWHPLRYLLTMLTRQLMTIRAIRMHIMTHFNLR